MKLIEEFKLSLLATQKVAKNTLKNYIADVNQFICWYESTFQKELLPKEITPFLIDSYVTRKKDSISERSLQRHISSLRKFTEFLIEHSLIEQSPFEKEKNTSFQKDIYQIKAFKNTLTSQKLSHQTTKNYIIDISHFTTWLRNHYGFQDPLELLTNHEILLSYQSDLLTIYHLAPASIKRKLSSLRKYIDFLHGEKKFQEPPPVIPLSTIIDSESPKSTVDSLLEFSQKENQPYIDQKVSTSIPPLRMMRTINSVANSIYDQCIIHPLVFMISFFQKNQTSLFQKIPQSSKFQPQNNYQSIKTSANDNYLLNAHGTLFSIKPPPHSFTSSVAYWINASFGLIKAHPFLFAFHVFLVTCATVLLCLSFYTLSLKNSLVSLSNVQGTATSSRTFAFQGRLTDNTNTPSITSSDIRFALYNNHTASGSALLWEDTKQIVTDTNGFFTVELGGTKPIPQSLFMENDSVFLGVTVGTNEELTPRSQIPNVSYAKNAETIEGHHIINEQKNPQNSILALNSSGNLMIGGNASPVFQASNGQFTLSGATLLLTTNYGSNQNVVLSPDGSGTIDLQKPLQNTSNYNNYSGLTGAVEIDDSLFVLASQSAMPALTLHQNGTGPLISASSLGEKRFAVDLDGTTFIGGNVGIGQHYPRAALDINGSATISANISFLGKSIPHTINILDSGSLNVKVSSGGDSGLTSALFIKENGNIGINSLNPTAKLDITGDIKISGATILNNQSYTWPGNSGSNGYILSTNGSGSLSWTSPPTFSSLWKQDNGILYPITISDFVIGGTSTLSAKFAITNITDTPTATLSGQTGGTYISANGILATTHNQTLTLGTDTTGNILFSPQGNVGIGTTNPSQAKLVVAGNVYTQGGAFIDDGTTLSAPDYVFEPDYPLLTLEEVESFIAAHSHLPRVPSRDEFKKDGINLSKMIYTLLEKVEELTLYTIAHNKTIKELQTTTQALTHALSEQTANTISSSNGLSENISEYIKSVINETYSPEIVRPIASIDTIQTHLISPLGSDTVVIEGKLVTNALTVENNEKNPVASIDSSGNASFSGTLSTQAINATVATINTLLVNGNATISGTLYADRIKASSIEGLQETLSSLSASPKNDPVNETQSLTTDTIYSMDTNASDTASFSSLASNFLTTHQGFTALGPSSLTDLFVSGQVRINKYLTIDENSLNVSGHDLEIQPFKQGGISFLSGEIQISKEGNLLVNGNAVFDNTVTVNNSLFVSLISPLPNDDLQIQLPKESALTIHNASGSSVLSISNTGSVIASGSGQFNFLTTNGIEIIRSAQADTSFTQTVATSSAGTATIITGELERTIVTPFVGSSSLIYLSSVSDTNGITPYIARQTIEDKKKKTKGSFTIAIPARTNKDITVNWWIIN